MAHYLFLSKEIFKTIYMKSFNYKSGKSDREKIASEVYFDDSLFEDEISLFKENMNKILKTMDATVQTYYLRGLILEKENIHHDIR